MAKDKDVVETTITEQPATETAVTPTAPVKVELTLDQQFEKLNEREAAVVNGMTEIETAMGSMGIAEIGAAPGFMQTHYNGLIAQKDAIAKERSALANKVPLENAKNYMTQLATVFATFGFVEPITFTVSFDPKNNTVTVGSTGIKRKASGEGKASGAVGKGIRNKKTILNGVEKISASEALKELKVILGLPDTFGDGNSAVRVLESLAKNPDYTGKFTVSFVEG